MEALRRLRRNSLATDTNVDRRLVTNVLLSFLTTPREDAKRFEMLGLLATILVWTDPEREKAGLQRAQGPVPRSSSSSSFWSRSPPTSPAKAASELEKTDETEVCFLLVVVRVLYQC
jgi:GRAB domain